MTIKRQLRTRLLKALRRIGLLCAKTATPRHRIRISKTVFPDGSIVLDPWRERKNKDTIYYGYNRK